MHLSIRVGRAADGAQGEDAIPPGEIIRCCCITGIHAKWADVAIDRLDMQLCR